jgi:hypothetical protein
MIKLHVLHFTSSLEMLSQSQNQYTISEMLYSVALRELLSANTSGKAGAKIPQLPLGDDSPPWGR